MKIVPWKKQTPSAAMLDWWPKMRMGIMGEIGSLTSIMAKRIRVRIPKMMREMTIADVHGRVTPPRRRPKRSINVPPTMVMAPSQSIAFKPAINGVLGVLRSRNIKMMTNASPPSGTVYAVSKRPFHIT